MCDATIMMVSQNKGTQGKRMEERKMAGKLPEIKAEQGDNGTRRQAGA
jgi:hypothetical protein